MQARSSEAQYKDEGLQGDALDCTLVHRYSHGTHTVIGNAKCDRSPVT